MKENNVQDNTPFSADGSSVRNPAEAALMGKVATPGGDEATSSDYTFWAPDEVLVEKAQIVHAVSTYAHREIVFHGVIDEVYRRSRRRDVLEEADRFGGDVRATIPLDSQGLTYARVKIVSTEPPVFAPPREESPVYLSGEAEARIAYGVDVMGEPLRVALLKNGGDAYAGPAYLDLDYLLGAQGAHLNVNGIAGAGTKSSFLLCVLAALLTSCRAQALTRPSAPDKRRIVPVILNVKGYDLLWLDRQNGRYRPAEEAFVWHGIGVDNPGPFGGARFVAPEQSAARAAVPVGREVERYSWGLGDVIECGLLPYLFGDEDREDENFLAILQDVEAMLTDLRVASDREERRLRQDDAVPQTFEALTDWVASQASLQEGQRILHNHAPGTWRKFARRLRRIVIEGEGVLVRRSPRGRPLNVVSSDTTAPTVVDITSIRDSALQRFVVATVFAQIGDARTGIKALPNLAYVIVLDELNRWAPRGATDPITRLIEKVVAEMRSQGVILFSAQQQASQVSTRVIENSAIRALGRTGSLELSQPLWGFLSTGAKRRAENLLPNEKLIYQVNFREPMQVRMPFPAWAMRRDEVARPSAAATTAAVFDEREPWER